MAVHGFPMKPRALPRVSVALSAIPKIIVVLSILECDMCEGLPKNCSEALALPYYFSEFNNPAQYLVSSDYS